MDTKFIDAVNNHNLIRVRIALANEILLNANGKSFHEMVDYAEQNLSDLYEVHDGEVFEEDYSKFTSDNVADIQNKLDFNFSKERLAYFEKVVRKVKGEQAKVHATTSESSCTSHPFKEGLSDENLLSALMLLGGGTIVAAGIVAAKTIPIVVGATVIGLGIVKVIKENINDR